MNPKNLKTAEAWRNEGAQWLLRGNPKKAQACYEEALETDENDHISMAAVGEILAARKDPLALGYCMQAVAAVPEILTYKERFLAIIPTFVFSQYNPHVENTLLLCFQTEGLDCSAVGNAWHSLLQHSVLLKKEPADLQQPLFLLGLKKVVVHLMPFEKFLTDLRKTLLEKRDPLLLPLAEALSHYCFATQYIFYVTPAESDAISALRLEIEEGFPDEIALALYACYEPLHTLKNRAVIEQRHASTASLRDMIRAQITDYTDLQKVRAEVSAITAIEEDISQRVQAQYEEFPYPRWTMAGKFIEDTQIKKMGTGKGMKILAAGCGTGREPAQIAATLHEADIVGIDLSSSSLAYAIRQFQKLSMTNIVFRQADILKLAGHEDRYDFIISGGVLHHMDEPERGFRTLAGLLKEDGVMRIGLYSEAARQPVVRARQAICTGNYPPTAEGMRAFRRESGALLKAEDIEKLESWGDYYSLNAYRDLLFHAQEHRFDIPRLERMLSDNGMEFVRFCVPEKTMMMYRKIFPQDTEGKILKNWHVFETAHPDTFVGMYQFWCRRAT